MLALLLLPGLAAATTCWVGAGGYVPSGPGAACVECDGRGYVLANGTCVFESDPSIPPPEPGQTLFCEPPEGGSTVSQFGVLCRECTFNGFLSRPDYCTCYSASTSATCAPMEPGQLINVTADEVRAYCEPFLDRRLGFFRDPPLFRYGREPATTPTECWSAVYGPDPGELFERGADAPLFTCATFTGVDPVDGRRRTCRGHGAWDFATNCTCDARWQGVLEGTDYFGQDAYTCGQCRDFWGPPPRVPRVDGDYCSAPYLPDPLTGAQAECGGHGLFFDPSCVCYFNETAGYWALQNVTAEFTTRLGDGSLVRENATVAACLRCADGYGPYPRCDEEDPDWTERPTLAPSTQRPTLAPTRAPTDVCGGCPESYRRNYTLTSAVFANDSSWPTPCFPELNPAWAAEGLWRLDNLTSADRAANVAAEACDLSALCTKWTVWLSSPGVYSLLFFADPDPLDYGFTIAPAFEAISGPRC